MNRLRKDLIAPTEGEIALGIARAFLRREKEDRPYPCVPYVCAWCHTRFLISRSQAKSKALNHYCSRGCSARGTAKARVASRWPIR